MKTEDIRITTDYIKLDSLLKLSGIAETGGTAKMIVSAGKVKLNGQICNMRGKKLKEGDLICIEDMDITLRITK